MQAEESSVMANDFDKILRENFREPKMRLLRELLQSGTTTIKPLVPRVQQTVIEREADTIAEVTSPGRKNYIIHIEWQSSNDPKMSLRMAIYDLLLYQAYEKDVLGIVLYVGREKLSMQDTLAFFGQRYNCRMLDIRSFDTELFLGSDDPGEVMMAILMGNDDQKLYTIRRILTKLRILSKGDKAELQKRVKQLEILSNLRGKETQQLIIQEEKNMPVTFQLTEDLRYLEGFEQGVLDTVNKLLKNGVSVTLVQEITGISSEKIDLILKQHRIDNGEKEK
ncbi:hypothetical protein [Hufsiella ginkgonis]|uniref:Rpn family recombination-promoting nuclease/putative transposase n=1 Tax=Hufsiella ginkgonis TaxID=2695274 RepID=A0A7K1Y266_9SPHI|nr:hypothetical protein [Hufsiella ginkgonis]MXV17158.1 hypothetical protein [Hufsiella ginkgonis]